MDPVAVREYMQQNFYTIIAVQAVIGFVLGLIPLLLSFRRKRQSLGYVALGVSIALSLLTPILSLIAVIVFIVLIVRKPAGDAGEPS